MVSCTGHPPSAETTQRLLRPLMLEMKAMLLPSGDHVGRPTCLVMKSFSMVKLRGSTCALGLEAICLGSVTAWGEGRVWAAVSMTAVLINMTIAKSAIVRMGSLE